MKLILVNIYPRETVARYLLSGYVLKAYLDKYYSGNGLSVEVLNFNELIRPEDLSLKLTEKNPDFIGYSCYIWNVETILAGMRLVKESLPGVVQVLGGPEISGQRILSLPCPGLADFYVVGEGEEKLLDLINYLLAKNKGVNIQPPEHVAFWDGKGLKISEGCANVVLELDRIPSIYLDKVLDENLYEKQQVFLETQRGCIYKCKYCVYRKFATTVRYYSKERVMRELDYLIVDKHVSALRIIDPIFTSDLKRAKELVRHLIELKNPEGVRLPWIYWEFDYLTVDEEFIELVASLKYRAKINNSSELPALDRPQLYSDMLKDYTVINSIGIESFCEASLRAVGRRRIDPAKFGLFMKMVNGYNIVLKMDLIFGLPFETLETYFSGLEQLLPYLENTDHVLNIHLLQILPGSELEELTGEYRIKYSQSAPHGIFSTNSLTEEEVILGVKLSAVLSRIFNSPIRGLFFEAWKRSGKSLGEMIKSIYSRICQSEELAATQLVREKMLYDSYWNDLIYREIPSKFIDNLLRSFS